MNKRYIKFSIVAIFALFFAACEKDYDAPSGEPNHNMVESSLKNSGNEMQVNGSFYLYDFSRGVESRTWELTPDATDLDGNELLSSSEQRIDVIFTEPGEKVVKLYQIFGDTVYSNGGFKDTHLDTTSIAITVLDSVRANFKAERALDNSPLNNSNGALNEVQAGREVIYMNMATGKPDDVKWIFIREDGVSSEFSADAESGMATVKLSSAGVYNVLNVASSTYGRDTLMYADYVQIVPSTDPMVLESVTADSKIYLQYGRDVFDPSECPTTAFNLKVSNEGKDYTVNVSSLAINVDDPSIIVLTLDADIYNSDEILISYDDAIGTLKSADDMKIDSFTDELVVFNKNDLFKTIGDGTIENSTNYNWAYAWWGGVYGMYNQDDNVSTTRAYEGSKSLYFDIQPEGGGALNYRDDAGNVLSTLSVEEGKIYEGSVMVYIEELGNFDTGDGFNPNVLWMRTDNWATLLGAQFYGSEVVGSWYKESFIYTSDKTEDIPFVIRLYNASSTVSHKVYIDNIKFEEIDQRP